MYGSDNEPVTLNRDVKAIIIPIGEEVNLKQGTAGFITQSLGGSFSIYVEGNLFRIAGVDGDALGKEPIQAPKLPDEATDADVETVIWQQLRTCYDPEIPVNIADLGLIYRCDVNVAEDGSRQVSIDMTLTAPGCGMGEILVEDVREKVSLIPTINKVEVELVFDPPWNQSMMSEEARLQTGLM